MSGNAQNLGGGGDRRRQPSSVNEDDVHANGLAELTMDDAVSLQQSGLDVNEDYTVLPAPQLSSSTLEALGNEEADDNADVTEDQIAQLLNSGSDDNADYYTLLGLSKDAAPTDSQIRSAYHRLSLAFHPDKQPPYLKNAAEGHFTRLRRAYETLIEPRKRVIYDLEGEEGVQEEYRQGGAMGPGGEAERQLSSIKVMKPNEFKRWFLGVMRGRERRALEAMVEHETSFHVGLDASGNFMDSYKVVRDGEDEYTFPLEPLRLQDIGVTSSFSVPLPRLGRLLERPMPSFKQLFTRGSETREEDEEDAETPAEWTDSLLPTNPSLTITGGISGDLDQGYAILQPIHVNGTEIPINDRFYTMSTQNISLGASLSHSFPELVDAPPNTLASKLQGLNINLEANILPHPSTFVLGLGKVISFASDTRPFLLSSKFVVRDSPHLVPPEVQIQLTRQLGIRGDKTAFLVWHSGERQWPSSLGGLLHGWLPMSSISLDYVARWKTMGQAAAIMRMGILFLSPSDFKEEGGTESSSADVNTSISLTAAPQSLSLELKHTLDLFATTPRPPIRSLILNSGDDAAPPSKSSLPSPRGLKVDLAATVSLPVSLTTSITGRRHVGNFTTLGLGVGLNPNLGLYLALSWERLGQSIAVPVALLPLEATTSTSILLALGIPWASYTALEFLILRPRASAKRQRLIKQQRRKLRKDVAKRREEAQQAVELMSPSVAYRQSVEDAQGGLVILSATYGVPSEKGSRAEWEEGKVIDVTIALAALVDDGQLTLARGLDKGRLIGFWDPAPLEKKLLEVVYVFGGRKHAVRVAGGKGLVLPRREHEVEE